MIRACYRSGRGAVGGVKRSDSPCYTGQSRGPEGERRLARMAAPRAPVYCGRDDTQTAQDKAVSRARTMPDCSATPPVKQTGGVTVLPASVATRRAVAVWPPAGK